MIYVVPDSNFLHISFGKSERTLYNQFYLNQLFDTLIDLRDSETCNDVVQILLPEVVLRELVEQKISQYEKDIEEYNMLSTRFGRQKEGFESIYSYRNNTLKQAKEFLNAKSVELIPICGSGCWNLIIEKAIRKEAPFEGTEGKADKGFKDVVIFFSIIEYARNNKGSYYFISKDKIFGAKIKNGEINRLKQEFFEYSEASLHVVNDIEELKRRIVKTEPKQILEKLNYMVEKERKNYQEYTKVPLEITRKIPVFTEEHVVGTLLNAEISSQWKKFMESWEECPRERYLEEADMTYEGCFDVEVKCNAKNKISIYFHEYQFRGGVHGGSAVYAYTYDLKEGRQLTLTEILDKNAEAVLRLVNGCINHDIESSEEGKYFEDKVDIRDLENIVFYVMDGDVHIVFNEYELGPYASGIIDLILCEYD